MAQIFARKSLETLKAEASDESPHGDVKLNRALLDAQSDCAEHPAIS
jgi:hypothetical protein